MEFTQKDIHRFWSRVTTDDDGCWNWDRVRPDTGKPIAFNVGNHQVMPRRFALIIEGVEVPGDQVVKDSCGNRMCVRPDHLWLIPTQSDQKWCSKCQRLLPITSFSAGRDANNLHGYCRPCRAEYKRSMRDVEIGRIRGYRVKAQFGISLEDVARMRDEQQNRCAICGRADADAGKRGLCIDHDHETGVVRELLCSNCNAGIAMFKHSPDWMRAGIAYLEKWSAIISAQVLAPTSSSEDDAATSTVAVLRTAP